MARTNRQRLRAVEEQIRQGKTPFIRTPLPGVEMLLDRYNIDRDTVFIPDPNKTPEQNKQDRAKFNGKKQYKTERAKTGEYQEQGSEKIDLNQRNRLMSRLADMLAKGKNNE